MTTPDAITFGPADIERWVERGILSADQAAAIREDLVGSGVPPVAGPAPRQTAAAREDRHGFNPVTVAYYFGAFLILLAYTVFMGLQWERVGAGGQSAIALGTVGGLWAVGGALRANGFPTGGGLLVFAGTGIVPLAVYSVQRAIGLWPDGGDTDTYREFYRTIAPAWISLEIVSGLVALAVLWVVRVPLLTLLLAFWGWYLSMDLARWVGRAEDWSWGDQENIVGALVGLTLLATGAAIRRNARGGPPWGRWFELFGHLAAFCQISVLTLGEGGPAGLLYLALYAGFVVASVWLQSSVFLTFGALGCYAYVSYLAFEVFAGGLGFVFALAAIGLAIVGSAVAYQRSLRPWLQERVGSGTNG